MKLYLAQHGHAVDKAEDPARPLSAQGERDVKAVARQLASAGIAPARIWHSGKLRTQQSAALLAKALRRSGLAEAIEGINPKDDVAEFARDADVWQDDTLVVGHLPFMSCLVSLLLSGDETRTLVSFTPGSVVCLQRDADNHWQIQWMLQPQLLAGEEQP